VAQIALGCVSLLQGFGRIEASGRGGAAAQESGQAGAELALVLGWAKACWAVVSCPVRSACAAACSASICRMVAVCSAA
jgi:hypothetical protein